MAYDQDTPLNSLEDPSVTEPKFRENFQTLNTFMSINHVDIETTTTPSADEGKHKFLQMPEQGSAPTTLENEGAVYTKNVGVLPQLFWRNQSDTSEQQITNVSATVTGPAFALNFASGLQIRTGTISHTGTSTPVSFTPNFSSTSYSVVLTPIGSAALVTAWNAQSLSVSGFTIASTSSGGGASFYYIALGK